MFGTGAAGRGLGICFTVRSFDVSLPCAVQDDHIRMKLEKLSEAQVRAILKRADRCVPWGAGASAFNPRHHRKGCPSVGCPSVADPRLWGCGRRGPGVGGLLSHRALEGAGRGWGAFEQPRVDRGVRRGRGPSVHDPTGM